MITIDAIRQYICTSLLSDNTTSIEDNEDLLISGMLDSIGVMKLAGHLESECDITIPAQDIVLENFSTLTQIHSYLTDRAAA